MCKSHVTLTGVFFKVHNCNPLNLHGSVSLSPTVIGSFHNNQNSTHWVGNEAFISWEKQKENNGYGIYDA